MNDHAFRVPPYLRGQIYAHARDTFPEECCGMVTRQDDGVLAYQRCENVAPEDRREDSFELDPGAYEAALEAGNLVAIVHSHTKGQRAPSRADMISQRATNVPWVIVVLVPPVATSCSDGDPALSHSDPVPRVIDEFSFPIEADAPVTGVPFRPGVADCVEAIVRYYRQQFGIAITSEPRDDEWWLGAEGEDPRTAPDLFMDYYRREGFRRLAPHEIHTDPGDERSPLVLQKGDVGLVRVMSPHRLNHGVVYTGGQMMVHHLLNRVSEEAPLSRWLPRIEVWLRHTSLDRQPETPCEENDPPLRDAGAGDGVQADRA